MTERLPAIFLGLCLVLSAFTGPVEGARRFDDQGKGTVLDNDTGLMWYKDAMPAKTGMPLEKALEFVESLNMEKALGYSDWRLPKMEELMSLVSERANYPALASGHPFVNVRPDFYWTSSTGINLVGYSWVVDLGSGAVMRAQASYCNFYYVWPVRTQNEDAWNSPVRASEQMAMDRARVLPTYLDLFDVAAPEQSSGKHPGVPKGVTAAAVSQFDINVYWDPPDDGDGLWYNVYSEGSSIRSIQGTSARITGLAPNTKKCFTVSARAGSGTESAQSSRVCATTWSGSIERGSVLAMGINGFGQLGDGTKEDKPGPVPVRRLEDIVSVSAGVEHTLAVKADGTVWAWGRNTRGQLGDGTRNDSMTASQVEGLAGIVEVAAGWYHSIALASDGKVWAWGRNYYGQVGDGTRQDRLRPVLVKDLNGVERIAAGWYHSMALTSDGQVWVWGWNRQGQLGDEDIQDSLKPLNVRLPKIQDIAGGMGHSAALSLDGSVFAWGRNDEGQLGSGNLIKSAYPVKVKGIASATDIECGMNFCLAILEGGKLAGWGQNDYGQLGLDLGMRVSEARAIELQGSVSHIAAGAHQSAVVIEDGTLWTLGLDYPSEINNKPPRPVDGIAGFDRIASGLHYIVMLKGN